MSRLSTRAVSADRDRVAALTKWFDGYQRDLPWRRKRNGYTALVAELMLQQTQVSRVLQHYELFLQRFPTVQKLASAEEQEVLVHWQGLGYYRRARHLHAAAKHVVKNHNGVVPLDVKSLIQLPGVGRYTAGSISSIVGGAAEPIVDGNVMRVVQRWDADRGATNDPKTMKRCWSRAEVLVHLTKKPGVLNEAMMELGSLICIPAKPKCSDCPVARSCAAHQRNLQNEIPVVKPQAKRALVHHHTVVVERAGKVLLVQRPERGLWANMWQPPTVETDNGISNNALRKRLELDLLRVEHCEDFEFTTSSRRVLFHVYNGVTRARRGTWQPLEDIQDLPMSNAHKKVLRVALNNS